MNSNKPQAPIIKGLPPIKAHKRGRPSLYPFDKLENGDAIQGPSSMVSAAAHYKKRHPDWNYVCQQQEDESWIIQRIKKEEPTKESCSSSPSTETTKPSHPPRETKHQTMWLWEPENQTMELWSPKKADQTPKLST